MFLKGCFSFMYLFFFYQGFLSQTLTTHRTYSRGTRKEVDYLFIPLYHFNPLQGHSDFYFVTLHVRWLSHIFNHTAAWIYLAACYLMRFTIWLIDDVIQGFCYTTAIQYYLTLHWKLNHTCCIDYHPCITSKPTNQVC